VVAHDGARGAGVDHRAHDLQGPELAGAAVDEVANEDGDAAGMPPSAALDAVAQLGQQGL
jgi:hypothetical protein